MTRPVDSEYSPLAHRYVSLVPESDILSVLEEQLEILSGLSSRVARQKETFAYAPGKWTVRQVVGHIGDVERVLGFRAFSFSRSNKAALPGFDEDEYVQSASFHVTPLLDLLDDFRLLRQSNLRMFRSLGDTQWAAGGVANANPVTVRALAYIMAGHVRHHLVVLRDRYGV